MPDTLLSELEKKNKCVLILNGFLKKKPIEALYLNILSTMKGRENEISGMINIFSFYPFQVLIDMFVYLLYQLSYSIDDIYIPRIDGESVVCLSELRKCEVLEDLFGDFKEKALKRDNVEIVFEDYLPMVQIVSYNDYIKLSLIDYLILHPEYMDVFKERLNSIYYGARDFFNDGYARRLKHILPKPLRFFGKANVGSGKN